MFPCPWQMESAGGPGFDCTLPRSRKTGDSHVTRATEVDYVASAGSLPGGCFAWFLGRVGSCPSPFAKASLSVFPFPLIYF